MITEIREYAEGYPVTIENDDSKEVGGRLVIVAQKSDPARREGSAGGSAEGDSLL